jgi:hypothetical protein
MIKKHFPQQEIVYALSRELDWTHLRCLIGIDSPLKMNLNAVKYAKLCLMTHPKPTMKGHQNYETHFNIGHAYA